MIKHIVFFKLEDNSKESKRRVQDMLLLLKSEIEEIQHIEVGLNFNNSDRAYDIALITDFKSKDDLSIYQKHPKHQTVVDYLKKTNVVSKVVDYEY